MPILMKFSCLLSQLFSKIFPFSYIPSPGSHGKKSFLNFILTLARPFFFTIFSHGHNRPDFFEWSQNSPIFLNRFSSGFLVIQPLSGGGGHRICAIILDKVFKSPPYTDLARIIMNLRTFWDQISLQCLQITLFKQGV